MLFCKCCRQNEQSEDELGIRFWGFPEAGQRWEDSREFHSNPKVASYSEATLEMVSWATSKEDENLENNPESFPQCKNLNLSI